MKTKKILFVSPLPPPFYGSAMSSRFCLQILQENEEFNVKNIQTNYSESFQDIGKITLKKVIGYFKVIIKIIWLSVAKRPDLVYIMPATAGFGFIRDFTFSILLKTLNKRIIYHLRTQITEKEKKSRIRNFIFKKAFNNCQIIVLGKELKDDIAEYVENHNIFILNNAITKTLTSEEFKKIESDRLQISKLRLIYVSNMMIQKGWPIAIEAADILNKHAVDFSFVFAGSWPSHKEETEYFRLVEKYGLGKKINYIGYINDEQKHDLLAQSDVLVFPTEYKYEAFPRVIIEAMEYGIPAITTKNGSIPSMVVHNKTGFLLSSVTAEEIARYAFHLMEDKKKLVAIGYNARKRFDGRFEESVYRTNFTNILTRVISKKV